MENSAPKAACKCCGAIGRTAQGCSCTGGKSHQCLKEGEAVPLPETPPTPRYRRSETRPDPPETFDPTGIYAADWGRMITRLLLRRVPTMPILEMMRSTSGQSRSEDDWWWEADMMVDGEGPTTDHTPDEWEEEGLL